jgi:hypothetical protein
MNGDLSVALQQFVYDTLSNDAGLMSKVNGIFDYVPPNIGQEADVKFPFIVIGEDNIIDSSDKCGTLKDPKVTIHIWTEAENKMVLKEIMQIVHDLIHYTNGNVDGVNITATNHEQSNVLQEAEGLIFHGIMVFTFYMEG